MDFLLKNAHICILTAGCYLMKVTSDIETHEVWNLFIRDGNEGALSKIYFKYYDLLFDYGRKHTQDIQLVEDTIQDIFINIIKFRKNIDSVQNLTGYLICTFRRQLYLELNKQKKMILTEQLREEHFDYFKSPEQDKSDKEDMERLYLTVRKCVRNLTDKQQEIMFLRFESEISYEEIAETLNISVDSCYKSIYRSIKTIRLEVKRVLTKG